MPRQILERSESSVETRAGAGLSGLRPAAATSGSGFADSEGGRFSSMWQRERADLESNNSITQNLDAPESGYVIRGEGQSSGAVFWSNMLSNLAERCDETG